MSYSEPLRPSSSFSNFPPVIKNLLIINGLVFLAQNTPMFRGVLEQYFALFPISGGLASFFPWQLLSYGFLHSVGDFMHIGFNMFALWMFGIQVEHQMGSKRFLTFYLICVIGAGITQLVFMATTGGYAATLGASGGVLGVLMAFALFFPNREIYLYFLFPIKAKYFVLGMAAYDLYSGLGRTTGTAHFAHIGGMVVGYLVIQFWRGKLPIKPQNIWRSY